MAVRNKDLREHKIRCPYCQTKVKLVYSNHGFKGQGAGWYCPKCFHQLFFKKRRKEVNMGMRKMSISEISSLVVYEPRLNVFLPDNVRKAIEKGKFLHLKYGFTNAQTFSRIQKVNDELIEIVGTPDKIEKDKGIVTEFKTFTSQESYLQIVRSATIQILGYEFLTGLEKGQIIIFDLNANKVKETREVLYKQELFLNYLSLALELKKLTEQFLAEYKAIQKKGDI